MITAGQSGWLKVAPPTPITIAAVCPAAPSISTAARSPISAPPSNQAPDAARSIAAWPWLERRRRCGGGKRAPWIRRVRQDANDAWGPSAAGESLPMPLGFYGSAHRLSTTSGGQRGQVLHLPALMRFLAEARDWADGADLKSFHRCAAMSRRMSWTNG